MKNQELKCYGRGGKLKEPGKLFRGDVVQLWQKENMETEGGRLIKTEGAEL